MGDPTILTQLARILENQERHMAQTTALEGRMAALEATVTREREAHAATVEVLNNRIAVLERTMEQGERKQRSSNLVLHGVPERPGLVDLEAAVLTEAAAPGARPPSTSCTFSAQRLGRLQADRASNRPRPVLLSFRTNDAKHAFLKNSRTLREKKIYLDEDLTPLQQQTRTALRDDYHRLKAEGKKPYWRGERLLFRDGERVEEHLPRRPPTHPAPQSGGAR